MKENLKMPNVEIVSRESDLYGVLKKEIQRSSGRETRWTQEHQESKGTLGDREGREGLGSPHRANTQASELWQPECCGCSECGEKEDI